MILSKLWSHILLGLTVAGAVCWAQRARADVLFSGDCVAGKPGVAILIDVTAKYDDIDISVLQESFKKILSELTGGERLFIDTIEDSFSHSRHLVEACVPYCPPMNWWEQLWSSCTEGALNQRRVAMASTLRTAMAQLLAGSMELPGSDIVRTIDYSLREHALKNGKIFIFSDMIENSSFISDKQFFQLQIEKLKQKITQSQLIPQAAGGVVNIFGVGRSDISERPALDIEQMKRLADFWRWYFTAASAASVEISPRFAY